MRDKLGEEIRINHILEAIGYIKTFTSGKQSTDLELEPMMRFAVERQLEVIGEAANHLSQETKNTVAGIDWKKIKAFRNIVAHEYFGIDHDIIWQILSKDVPELEHAILLMQNNK